MESTLDLSKLKAWGDTEEARRAMIIMAKASEKMERFEDMCQVMRELLKMIKSQCKEMTEEERTLVATAFKNIAGQLRGAWRALWTEDKYVEAADVYKLHLQAQLSDFCNTSLDLISTLDRHPNATTENKVFVLKLRGDFYRYLAEVTLDTSEAGAANANGAKASEIYGQATALADSKLDPTHPLRLGVALNFAVCYREIFKDTKQACLLAKKAFNSSIARLDDVEDEQYNDTTLIMQLLRDNLTLWASETG